MKEDTYELGEQDGVPFVAGSGGRYTLSCHPYDPCLYITDENGVRTVVRNAFDPATALAVFREGRTLRSATGREYSERDFCEMVAFAAGKGVITIDEAEKVFGGKKEEKTPRDAAPPKQKATLSVQERVDVIESDPFYAVLKQYPDSAVDFCLVKSTLPYDGIASHRAALARGAGRIIAEDGDLICTGSMEAKRIPAKTLFAPPEKVGEDLNYRTAFLYPPYPAGYTDEDFETLNAALFPKGREALEVFQWSTSWSDYFDEGHEWWGALCLTVYDRETDRFIVILASATD